MEYRETEGNREARERPNYLFGNHRAFEKNRRPVRLSNLASAIPAATSLPSASINLDSNFFIGGLSLK